MSFERLVKAVLDCGAEAVKLQDGIRRDRKQDGSIVTEADKAVDAILCRIISAEFPGCPVVSEESESEYTSGSGEFIFAIDPIDGTDSYSQGLPGWCVAVGLLDRTLVPVGGIIYAPRWGSRGKGETLMILEPGTSPIWNGLPLEEKPSVDTGRQGQLVISSRIHKKLDFSRFPGKIRSFGSAQLHLIAPLLYREIVLTAQAPCYIWDIAAAHAFLRTQHYRLEYLDTGNIDYTDLLHRTELKDFILAGRDRDIDSLKTQIHRVETKPYACRGEGT